MKGKRISSNVANNPGYLIAFGLLWLLFTCPFFIVMLVAGPDLAGALLGGLFLLVGVAILAAGMFIQFTRMRIGQPQITLSDPVLRVGQTFTASYLHTFPRDVEIGEIYLQLIFRETATYQQGTDTRTVTYDHLIDEHVAPGGTFRAGSFINQSYEFQIPPDGMHNLDVRRNRLQWYLILKMSVPRLPDFVEQLELNVLPEMA